MITQAQELFDLKAGIAAKESGQNLVSEYGEDFVSTMRSYAKVLAVRNGTVTSDDLRKHAAQYGIAPHHSNAWGAIFKAKGWRSIGFVRSAYVGNHARTIRVWEWRP